jgi:hypothetical protein
MGDLQVLNDDVFFESRTGWLIAALWLRTLTWPVASVLPTNTVAWRGMIWSMGLREQI